MLLFSHYEADIPHRASKALSNSFPLLDGLDYECLILEESGQSGEFRRLGYIEFVPDADTVEEDEVDAYVEHRIHMRDLLRKAFLHGELLDSVCGMPDQTGRYTITLV
jgi:hypothetical protein